MPFISWIKDSMAQYIVPKGGKKKETHFQLLHTDDESDDDGNDDNCHLYWNY